MSTTNFISFIARYAAIEIPMLQRDYAQGRPKEIGSNQLNDKGRNFLDYLFEHLSAHNGIINLDLIYGSIEKRNPNSDEETFIPLDGQQRLTTLWLLYWYIHIDKHVGRLEKSLHILLNLLRRFSYATRASARDFCQQICSEIFVAGYRQRGNKTSSQYIRELLWFTSSYAYDPTIDGMLHLLDYIEAKQAITQLQLDDLNRIQFQTLDIGEYNLSDDLYIKMNGRGKPLSSVENLKADFINYLRKHRHDFSKSDSYDRKLDHTWADLAWGEAMDDITDDIYKDFDLRYLRLFNRYFYNLWVSLSENTTNNTIPTELTENFTGEVYTRFLPYETILDSSEDRLDKMVVFFDFLSSSNGIKYSKLLYSPWESDTKQQAYPYFLDKNKLGMRERIALYALMLFIDNTDEQTRSYKAYEQWMRIVWNLIIDSKLRTYTSMRSYILLLDSIAPYCSNIEEYLCTAEDSNHPRLAFEQKKLRYLHKHPSRRDSILLLELNKTLQGQIDFSLDFDCSDSQFSTLAQLTNEVVDARSWQWNASYLWPGIIALLKQPLFDLEYEGMNGYLAHKEHGSGIDWRFQLLLNMGHIAQALRMLLTYSLEKEHVPTKATFERVCTELCKAYEYKEELYWHYPLVKYDLLREMEHGRLYHRYAGVGICLQRSWRVTENSDKGYYKLEGIKKPKLLIIGSILA